jgi:RNA polymerase sigma factor (sigma-70 family)
VNGSTVPAPPEPSHEQLLTALREGRPGAWARIVRRYSPVIDGTIRGFRLQNADANDAAQNTWLRFAENQRDIRDPACLPGWLRTVARRECLALLRARRLVEPDHDLDTEPDPVAGPEELAVARDTARALRQVVAGVPEPQRALLAALFTGPPTTYADIAVRCHMPVGSIGPTRGRLLGRLRRELASAGVSAS